MDEEQPDAVLIVGDMYDKAIPPAEAEKLFDDFLCQLASRELQVFVISGNHDLPERIAFSGQLAQNSGKAEEVERGLATVEKTLTAITGEISQGEQIRKTRLELVHTQREKAVMDRALKTLRITLELEKDKTLETEVLTAKAGALEARLHDYDLLEEARRKTVRLHKRIQDTRGEIEALRKSKQDIAEQLALFSTEYKGLEDASEKREKLLREKELLQEKIKSLAELKKAVTGLNKLAKELKNTQEVLPPGSRKVSRSTAYS